MDDFWGYMNRGEVRVGENFEEVWFEGRVQIHLRGTYIQVDITARELVGSPFVGTFIV